jgi:coenzyme F420-reducing hydrogenase delta subunit/NAD-dependent dihydropyrimidine dehydrogenase PreA subunit
MSCGAGAEVIIDKCAACLTCLRVCPFGIPKVADVARVDSALCQACGICIAECPANAIVPRGKAPDDLAKRTAGILAQKHGQVIAYICGQHASARRWQGATDVQDVTEVYIPTVAGISVTDILSAFENGAGAVLVVACRDGQDRYPQANRRIALRVEQARDLLREAGVSPERLKLLELA